MRQASIRTIWAIFLGFNIIAVTCPINCKAERKSSVIKLGKLEPGGKMRVYGLRCTLKVLPKATERHLTVRCVSPRSVKSKPSILGIVYLSPGEELRLTSKKCDLHASFDNAVLNVFCSRKETPEEPTVAPTATPSATATPLNTFSATPIATATPSNTPSSTPTSSPTSTPTPVAGLIFLTASVVSLPINSTVTFQVQNTSTTVTALNIQATLPASWTDVLQTTMNCASVAPGQVCTITIAAGNTPHSQADVPLKGSNTTVALTQIEIIPVTTISSSVSNLNIAVSDPGLNPALTGSSRLITITNTGGFAADNLNINVSTLPAGTTFSSTCRSTLATGSTCTLTFTPGSSPSSAVGDTNPSPVTIDLTSSNTNSLSLTASILTYGSVMEGGYVFSVDDTTPVTGSIAGKVAALADQSLTALWASNGSNAVSEDLLPGIDETSTSSSGSPTYVSAQVNFNAIYSNEGVFPFPSSGSFAACNAGRDGACNSANILVLYNSYLTNYGIGGAPYTLSSGPTSVAQYAAGLCTATISGFSDWYLPAICEMGFDNLGFGSGCGTSGSPLIQNMQSNLVANGNVGALSGFYWSSTEYSGLPEFNALFQFFDPTSSIHATNGKGGMMGVRCARALVP